MNGSSPSIPAMDDEIMSSRLIVHTLEEEGGRISIAASGEEV